jgi:hypothetical protein
VRAKWDESKPRAALLGELRNPGSQVRVLPLLPAQSIASQIHGLAVFDSFRSPENAQGKLMAAGEVALRRPAYDGADVTVKCDEALAELCGAGFAFSGSGSSRLFGGPGRDRYRIRGCSHGSVVA